MLNLIFFVDYSLLFATFFFAAYLPLRKYLREFKYNSVPVFRWFFDKEVFVTSRLLLAFGVFSFVVLWLGSFTAGGSLSSGAVTFAGQIILFDQLGAVSFFTLMLNSVFLILAGLYLRYLEVFVVRPAQQVTLLFFFFVVLVGLRFLLYTNDLLLILLLLEVIAYGVVTILSLQSTRGNNLTPLLYEAGVKYFFVNAVSSLLLFLALVFFAGLSGLGNLEVITDYFLYLPFFSFLYFESFFYGISFLFLAFFFKFGVAPFHLWVADVYGGIEILNVFLLLGYVGPGVFFKFFFICKLAGLLGCVDYTLYNSVVLIVAVLSILVGTIGAYAQQELFRFFAYGGISHAGYILLLLSTNDLIGYAGAFFYLFTYMLMLHIFFCLYSYLRGSSSFLTYRPWVLSLSQALRSLPLLNSYTISMVFFIFGSIWFSFAGIPPLLGFFSKFFLLASVIQRDGFTLLIVFVVLSFLINSYLYIRFIVWAARDYSYLLLEAPGEWLVADESSLERDFRLVAYIGALFLAFGFLFCDTFFSLFWFFFADFWFYT